jgi:dTDP-glucose 4,6-dehydratase
MAKTLLITGGAGFIGSSFVRLALEKNYKIIILDALTYAGHKENLEGLDGKIELVVGDIRDRALCAGLLEHHHPNGLIHFAAESHVDNSIASPGEFIDTNISGTYHLLEATRHYVSEILKSNPSQFRYVQVSTDEVFGALGSEGYFSETSPYAPNSPYSASKAAADHLVRAWHHTYGLSTIVTHCSNNYGPRQLPEKLIPVIITRALAGKELPVYGDGQHRRDWIHVEDHCQGILLAFEQGRSGEHYCFGGRAEYKNLDLVHVICDYLDKIRPTANGVSYRSLVKFVPDRLGHDRRYAIDDQKAETVLGFARNWQFDAGIAATIDWYLANEKWCELVSRKVA